MTRWVRSALLLALAAPAPLVAQERVAQLAKVQGKVTVTRAADAQVDEARQVGARVVNGSVFPGDVVATEGGAAATLAFTDGSQVDLKEKTSLTIQEKDLAQLLQAGKAQKPVGRTIRVLAGDVLAKVVPNPQIATEFETPSGVAAVKGTTISISVRSE